MILDDIRTFVTGATAAVLMTFFLLYWRQLRWTNRIFIPLFCTLVLTSTISRLFVYDVGVEPIPSWLPVFYDYLLGAICLVLILRIWLYQIHLAKKK